MTKVVKSSALVMAALWVGVLFCLGFVVAPYLFALCFRLVWFKSLEESVGAFRNQAKLPRFAVLMRRTREPKRINVCILAEDVPEQFRLMPGHT